MQPCADVGGHGNQIIDRCSRPYHRWHWLLLVVFAALPCTCMSIWCECGFGDGTLSGSLCPIGCITPDPTTTTRLRPVGLTCQRMNQRQWQTPVGHGSSARSRNLGWGRWCVPGIADGVSCHRDLQYDQWSNSEISGPRSKHCVECPPLAADMFDQQG